MPYQRILVPTDFSEYGDLAIAHAERLARAVDAELVLFHVFDRPPPPKVPASDQALREYLDVAAKEANDKLQALVASVSGVTCRGVSAQGKPWLEIVHAAEREKCDLICMASHGRGALADMLMGGVTERVLHRAPCPILIVRPAKMRRPVEDDE